MDNKQSVISTLEELNISYDFIEHDSVYTIEEMEAVVLSYEDLEKIVKANGNEVKIIEL